MPADVSSAAAGHASAAAQRTERAFVKEVFLSFQGEGLLLGERQLFIRLAGCNIRCPWCDTPDALVAKEAGRARIEEAPGSGRFRELENPLGVFDVLREVQRIASEHGPVRWVSITGGEPTI
ncbi:MAG TPA: 7-carboxy-7-deazaguanine synthase QueE, partial [Planctomycetota bacterium]|nr:7-carboxy-7-deazaguanine synthase QueE [Planctomycetota bacterium]